MNQRARALFGLGQSWVIRRLLNASGVEIKSGVRFYGRPRVRRVPGSRILVEHGAVLCGEWHANTLEARGPVILQTVQPGATLRIGPNSGLTSATISAARSVVLGSRVLVGAGVLITDSDHHYVEHTIDGLPRRFAGMPAPSSSDAVEVGDDVFVGARSIILKGVRIGAGSVIAAGSVVVSDVPPQVVVAGNPARIVRTLSDQ